MRPEELRMGNYFKWSDFASMGIGVDRITHGQQIMDYIQLKEGIPLTEKWLLEFGFAQDVWEINGRSIKTDLFFKGHLGLAKVGGNNPDWQIFFDKTVKLIVFIQYVHQLQNLYFALTGEELVSK
jgi:hypothetical protein